jgi:hypothetical protein
MMAVVTHEPHWATPADDDSVRLNVEQAQRVVAWLDSLGVRVRPSDRGAVGADLSDLYVAADAYRRMLDALLELPANDHDQQADAVADLASEIRHIAWHARSVVSRLDRLVDRLAPDDAADAAD